MGCSRGVPGLFRGVPGCSGGVPGMFRGVPGCSGFYRHPLITSIFGLPKKYRYSRKDS